MKSRSTTSPTASTSPAGSRRRCGNCSIGISGPTGSAAAAIRRCGTRSARSTTANCGKRTRCSRRDLIAFVRSAPCGRPTTRRAADDGPAAGPALSLDALTIGFARRFATYKRANLLFQDLEQIAALINDPQLPVQLVFAGKAHPHDLPGKEVLQRDRPLRARSAVLRQDRVRRGLRHQRRPNTWCKGSTCGSTTRVARSRLRAPAA